MASDRLKLSLCLFISLLTIGSFSFKESKKTILVKDVELFNGCNGFKLKESCGRQYFYVSGVPKKIKNIDIISVEGKAAYNYEIISAERMSKERLNNMARLGQTRIIFTGGNFDKKKIENVVIEITYFNIFQKMVERISTEL